MTPKQQRFVDEYLIELNATAAARRAGYKHPNKQGPALLVNLGIKAAIFERQAEDRERCEITKDSVTEMLREDRQLAKDCRQAGAAVSASMGIAKLHGLIRDKREITTPRVSREENIVRIDELLDRLGLHLATAKGHA